MLNKSNRIINILLCLCLFFQQAGSTQIAPETLSAPTQPPIVLRYLSVNSANPYNYFNFLLDTNSELTNPQQAGFSVDSLNNEATKLINYFFLGLTLPSNCLWVNLKPDEPERITSGELAKTDLGKTLLEQDLKLKKDTSNYLHPQNPKGKQYWEKLYQVIGRETAKKIAITGSNRVWIVPDEAVVMETEDGALIVKATLKVLLESEYLSVNKKDCAKEVETESNSQLNNLSEQLIKEIILPSLTQDINNLASYAPLRQIYYSLILAEWFKRKCREIKKSINPTNITNSIYTATINQGYTQSLESETPWSKDNLYQQYLVSYNQGEYKFQDTILGLKRIYFSGGVELTELDSHLQVVPQAAASPVITTTATTLLQKDDNQIPVIHLNSNPQKDGLSGRTKVVGKQEVYGDLKITCNRAVENLEKSIADKDVNNILKYYYTQKILRAYEFGANPGLYTDEHISNFVRIMRNLPRGDDFSLNFWHRYESFPSYNSILNEFYSIYASIYNNRGPYYSTEDAAKIAELVMDYVSNRTAMKSLTPNTFFNDFRKTMLNDLSTLHPICIVKLDNGEYVLLENNPVVKQDGNLEVIEICSKENPDKRGHSQFRVRKTTYYKNKPMHISNPIEVAEGFYKADWPDDPSIWTIKARNILKEVALQVKQLGYDVIIVSEGGVYKGTMIDGTDLDTYIYVKDTGDIDVNERIQSIFREKMTEQKLHLTEGLRFKPVAQETSQISFEIRPGERGILITTPDNQSLLSKQEGFENQIVTIPFGEQLSVGNETQTAASSAISQTPTNNPQKNTKGEVKILRKAFIISILLHAMVLWFFNPATKIDPVPMIIELVDIDTKETKSASKDTSSRSLQKENDSASKESQLLHKKTKTESPVSIDSKPTLPAEQETKPLNSKPEVTPEKPLLDEQKKSLAEEPSEPCTVEVLNFINTKFERQKQGQAVAFKPGEQVESTFLVQDVYTAEGMLDPNRIELLVVQDNIDVRQSDTFIIDVSPKEYAKLKSQQGLPLKGIVKISGKGKYEISNMFSYPAKIKDLNSNVKVNPDPNSILDMDFGMDVIIEGEVLEYIDKEHLEEKGESRLVIKTAGGTIFSVHPDVGYVNFAGGILENIDDKKPEPGDIVRVTGYISKEGTDQRYANKLNDTNISSNEKIINTTWCRSVYLLKPSPQRSKKDTESKEKNQKELESLKKNIQDGDYTQARKQSASLIKQELTTGEKKQLEKTLQIMPKNEQPILVWDRYLAEKINEQFNTDIDRMTMDEYLEFMRKVATRKILGADKGDASYLYRIMDDLGISKTTQEEILTLAVDNGWLHLKQQKMAGEESKFADEFMFSQSFKYLCYSIKSPTATAKIIDLFLDIINTEETNDGSEMSRAIENVFADSQQNSEIMATFQKKIPSLREIRNKFFGRAQKAQEEYKRTGEDWHLYRKNNYIEQTATLSGIINRANPIFKSLAEGDFHENTLKRISALSKTIPFFSVAKKTLENKRYKFVIYGESKTPLFIEQMMNGRIAALTWKQEKIVYVDLDTLAQEAVKTNRDAQIFFDEMLANELTHVLSSLEYTPLDKETIPKELEKMDGKEYLPSEIMLQDIVKEEILSQIVGDIVNNKLKNPSYQVAKQDFLQGEIYTARIKQLKIEFLLQAIKRIFGISEEELLKKNEAINRLLERELDYINSEEIEKFIVNKLEEFEFFTPEKATGKGGINNSSPLNTDTRPGGIDLSDIDLTLKDEKFVSSLNPADLKVLLAASALNQGWDSLAILRIHEAIGLLRDDCVQEFTQWQTAFQLMESLKSKQPLDSEVLRFYNILLNPPQSLSELKLALYGEKKP